MQIKNKVLGLWLAGLLVGLPADVTAATVDILASFRPDPSQPARNVFKNHTPPGNSYCTWAPQYCNETRYSIGLPIDFRMSAPIVPGGDDRNHLLFHAPTERRNITVVHDETGEAETCSSGSVALAWCSGGCGRTPLCVGNTIIHRHRVNPAG